MSIIKSKKIMGKQFSIYAESFSNRVGFKHRAELKINGYTYEESLQYYNRTWERYQFESVLHAVIYKAIEIRKEDIKEQYKKENKIMRITEKHKNNVENLYKHDDFIKACNRFKNYIDKEHIHF